jgi:hypothetical protein
MQLREVVGQAQPWVVQAGGQLVEVAHDGAGALAELGLARPARVRLLGQFLDLLPLWSTVNIAHGAHVLLVTAEEVQTCPRMKCG